MPEPTRHERKEDISMAQKMDQLQMHMLEKVADLHSVPEGAYNIRSNGSLAGRNTTANIDIVSKEDKPGIDIIIKPGTKNESVHIPVIVSQSGLKDLVYNDFYIGEGADVTIVAGCGIHCGGDDTTEHDGIHTFHIGKNAKVKYVEKHYGEGEGTGDRILNPTTVIYMDTDSYMEMETTQIKGVDSTIRDTKAELGDHDEHVSFEDTVETLEKLYPGKGREYAEKIREYTIALYKKCAEYALTKNIIIADTKFEFGLNEKGEVVLGDEMLTPDSSRFWPLQGYQPGQGQPSFDKQYVRDWLKANPDSDFLLPQDVIDKTVDKYVEAYEMLSGEKF